MRLKEEDPPPRNEAKAVRAMEELIVELRLFLELLDHEYLTSTVREKKAVITDILLRIQPAKGLEVKDHAPKQEPPGSLPAPPQMPLPEIPQPWLPPDSGPPPLPTSSLPEGYYEEAVPLSPGKAPEYITANYDSDAMSSSYESYDEEEEDGKGKKTRHQWPSEEASMDLVKDAKICAFLLRKKRFGQWTKLLCVIKDTKLLCYKSSKDQQPQMELPLQGCSVTYLPKDSKKKQHELRITQQGTDPLVLAVQSKEQAEQWLKVIREVYSGCSGPVDSEFPPPSSSPVHKAELEKLAGEAHHIGESSLLSSEFTGLIKRKKSSKSESKGTVSKVTGKKITKIIGLGKKKPSTDEQTSSAEEDVPTCGYLNVLSNSRWRERWCRVRGNKLVLHKDRTDLKTHIASIPLRGCEVIPGLDSRHPLTFRLLRNGQEVAVLEAASSEDMGRWIGILLAETGSSADPGALHYDYIDVELSANVIQTAKQAFCFMNRRVISANPYLGGASNGYAHPSGTALHYDDVPCVNGSLKGKKPPVASNGVAGKGKPLNSQQKKADSAASVKRTPSNADQYKYGKNRVEADAKRLQTKEDELLRRKEALRNRLAQLRKERRDLRAAIEVNAGTRGAHRARAQTPLPAHAAVTPGPSPRPPPSLRAVLRSLEALLVNSGQAPGRRNRSTREAGPGPCPAGRCGSCPGLREGPVPVNSAAILKKSQPAGSSPCRGHVLRKAKVSSPHPRACREREC
ncbi:actin filament-associated protein 1 [Pteropus vampyrus]|uniref:Actin filament-associated protein 1 n=1 Tax=Pteropus vampyrus TaxID=132908 RepID=A0A6P6C2Q8_PTEVA|nr:actin filament-associated protein 1 [Pteropus vampyrus]